MRKDKIDPDRHYPPAYYRYREKHPTISIVLSNDIKSFLDQYKGDLTYKDLIKDILNNGQKINEKLESEYKAKLDSEMSRFIEEKDREFEERLDRKISCMQESIMEEIKRSFDWKVSGIRSDIVNSFARNQEGKILIWKIFEAGGFSGNSMIFPEGADNSMDGTEEV